MLDHPLIEVVTGCDFASAADRVSFDHVIYTGPIDEYFEYKYGPLPYRSLRFEFETRDVMWAQPVGCINEPDADVPFTRTTEYKHLTGQQHAKTVLSREYPTAEGDPYYPIPRPENRELYRKYATLAAAQRHVTFVGRLAEYKYFNMDQVVASALVTFEDLARTAAVALDVPQSADAGDSARSVGVPRATFARIAPDRWRDQLYETGHDIRDGDVDRIADLGVRATRYPVLWEKVAPRHPRARDYRWAARRLSALADRGVEPIVTLLHHGSGPAYTSLVDPAFPHLFAEYAAATARRFRG